MILELVLLYCSWINYLIGVIEKDHRNNRLDETPANISFLWIQNLNLLFTCEIVARKLILILPRYPLSKLARNLMHRKRENVAYTGKKPNP